MKSRGVTTTQFFKPEDFNWLLPDLGSTSKRVEITDFCNAKLERERKVVYSNDRANIWAGGEPREGAEYSALLIAIEPIEKVTNTYELEKALRVVEAEFPGVNIRHLIESSVATQICTHPSEKKIYNGSICETDNSLKGSYRCECGARVKPSKFEEAE